MSASASSLIYFHFPKSSLEEFCKLRAQPGSFSKFISQLHAGDAVKCEVFTLRRKAGLGIQMWVLGLLLSLPKSFCETNSLWSLNLWEVWAALTPARIFSAKHFPLDVAPGFHFFKTCRGVFSLLKSCVYITVPSKSAVIASWSHSSFLTPFSLFFRLCHNGVVLPCRAKVLP